MAIRIRPIEQITRKYQARAAVAGQDYLDGINAPSRDQAEAAAAAAPTWAAGVQQAIADNRYADGVTDAGTAKWRARSQSVGAARYPQGIQAGLADYRSGVAPFLEVLQGLELPPRMPRGDPSNNQRVMAVNAALRARALQG